MSLSPSSSRVGSASALDELIPLGHNWFIHDPKCRSVRVRYDPIPPHHDALPFVEVALEKVVRTLAQTKTWRASVVPCLHRSHHLGEDTLSVVLHATMLHVEVLDMVHLMESDVPVHLYIGDPLTTGTPFDVYSPEKLSLPARIVPGDPIFCSSTERVAVFAAYLHSPDDDALYGLTVGQAVVPQPGFLPHRRLLPRSERHQRRMRNSQLALHCLGRPLSNPAVKVVERAVQQLEAERAMLFEDVGDRPMSPATDQRHSARLRKHDAELAILQNSLNRPHEYDVGHACAAEAIIRPCTSSDHRHSTKQSRQGKEKSDDHTHLLSWAVMRMSLSRATDNPVTLQSTAGILERGAAVTMHVRDPNLERPLGPYRDGIVNGAPASVVLDGYVAQEWAVFPAPGWKGVRFAARGDAGALITSRADDAHVGGGTTAPLAMLHAIPERGPYGLVTPLTTILRRVRDVTGLQLRFQASRRREPCV
ncbi:hypothetical protein PYCCODRAFT_1411257 [Trametes coccinea BRFM310]|uniref:Uncharacterized protein n=1 Tax=Trametes coccinea (strain BRFM310) TaxID=1353009 RepID=A0A1Y2IMK4_TRAC3|nr:hypothetical protein PYCCODRAFT_1411257 [Trametes coccinea BRFM310]